MKLDLYHLKQKHIEILKSELSLLEKKPLTSGLVGIVHLHKNLTIIKDDIQKIVEKINKKFVEEINDEEYEKAFSDEGRIKCYEESFPQYVDLILVESLK